MNRILPAVGLLALALWLAVEPADVQGCGGAYREGDRVDVADETALIIWDEAAKKQHFIRRATFVGSAYDFGFLVPTPNRPEELEPADPELFPALAKITAPKIEYREVTQVNLACGGASAPKAAADAELPGGVVVLEQKRVGDLDAAVLAFRDVPGQNPTDAAGDLLVWLNRNGYAVRPDLTEWLLPYVQNKWIITAFKIAGQPVTDPPTSPKSTAKGEAGSRKVGLKSSVVRMTFKADRPFFPYREPADQRDENARGVPRLLRVYVAAKHRMSGKLGDGTTAWPGKTVWANAVKDEERIDTLKRSKLSADVAPGEWWLTEFEDRSTPRPGTDEVYFETAADQSVVMRQPRVIVSHVNPWWLGPVCIAVPLAMLVGLALLIRLALRRIRTGGV